ETCRQQHTFTSPDLKCSMSFRFNLTRDKQCDGITNTLFHEPASSTNWQSDNRSVHSCTKQSLCQGQAQGIPLVAMMFCTNNARKKSNCTRKTHHKRSAWYAPITRTRACQKQSPAI